MSSATAHSDGESLAAAAEAAAEAAGPAAADFALGKRSRVCFVCGGPTETFHLNYGASTCFSCRAFFRRAIQKTRNPSFDCKKGGGCEVTVKTRRKCQRCRWDLCIAAGMKPDCVLNDDQKSSRFRKMFQRKRKREEEEEEVEPEPPPPPSPLRQQQPQPQQQQHRTRGAKRRRPSIVIAAPRLTSEASTSTSPIPFEFNSDTDNARLESPPAPVAEPMEESAPAACAPPAKSRLCDPEPMDTSWAWRASSRAVAHPIRKRLSFADRVRIAWEVAHDQMPVSKELLKNLVAGHNFFAPISRRLIAKQMATLAQLFRDFAMQQPEFQSLCPRDQERLLSRNSSLFVQYFLGRYLGAETGGEQLLWLFASNENAVWDIPYDLEPLPYSYFRRSVRMFDEENDLAQFYVCCTQQLRIIGGLAMGEQCSSMVALCCLFNADHAAPLENPAEVRKHSLHVHAVAEWAHERVCTAGSDKLQRVVQNLELMDRVFDWEAFEIENDDLTAIDMEFAYTHEEEKWLTRRLANITETFQEVTYSKDVVGQVIEFSRFGRITKGFVSVCANAYLERFRRIMKLHEEFTALSDSDQMRQWRAGAVKAYALVLAKLETCRSGYHQHRVARGHEDETRSKADPDELTRIRKITMREMNAQLNIMDDRCMARFDALVQRLSSLVRNSELFKLMMLVTLFACDDGLQQKRSALAIRKLQKRYLLLLRRRMQHHEGELWSHHFAQFVAGFRDIDEMGGIINRHLL